MEEVVTKTMDGARFGRKGFDWRKLAWSVAIALLLGFLTGMFTNFDSAGVIVFFLVLYFEYRMSSK